MARTNPTDTPESPSAVGDQGDPGSYTVVARRYRPGRFEEVVGQGHVVQALRNAIRLNRVTHAYLFSGTRGVGKTSLARIFAKCLNCVEGPTDEPCQVCDICRSIAAGQDVDVIEIDGASNNGVEAVRELRQNAGLRPSRARFKIYYIDEVHMLSTGAFNALLKTLEEPPPHVKFFFATTEANKIPITVLSRCQRYDLAGIAPEEIQKTLAAIAGREGVRAEPEALAIIARRAAGSMRDAQSLLEQLLSSGGQDLDVETVHQLLGTASDERTLDLLDALSERDAGRALTLLESAVDAGVQPADLMTGALEFLRDVMVLAAGAGVAMLAATPRQHGRLQEISKRWGLDSTLAAMQILAETKGRMRGSPHGRLLVELALARVARLEDLSEMSELIGRLAAMEQGAPPPPANRPAPARPEPPPGDEKKKPAEVARAPEPRPAPPPPRAEPAPAPPTEVQATEPVRDEPLGFQELAERWPRVVEKAGHRAGMPLSQFKPADLEPGGVVVIDVRPARRWAADLLGDRANQERFRAATQEVLGRPLAIRFRDVQGADEPADGQAEPQAGPRPAEAWRDDPLVRQVQELFEAKPIRVDVDSDDNR